MTTSQARAYHAWLLRVWLEPSDSWRCSLEDPHSGERVGFSNLEALVAFLLDQLALDQVNASHLQVAPRH